MGPFAFCKSSLVIGNNISEWEKEIYEKNLKYKKSEKAETDMCVLCERLLLNKRPLAPFKEKPQRVKEYETQPPTTKTYNLGESTLHTKEKTV